MADIFIRDIQEDERVVAPLHTYVQERLGRQHTIGLSAETRPHVERKEARDREQHEISAATVILLMFSQRSVQSQWVHVAAETARRAQKMATYLCFWDLSAAEVSQLSSRARAFNLRNELASLITSLAHHLHIRLPVPFLTQDMLSFQRLRSALERRQRTIEKEKIKHQ
jgi:hypothetical protein